MNETYTADQIMDILINVRKIQDPLAMLKECYFSEDNRDLFLGWFMTVSHVTEPLFPGIIDFLSWAHINIPDYEKAGEPE